MGAIAKIRDVTGALRARRYRRKNASKSKGGVTVNTADLCALASRIGDGRATLGDRQLAERVIMMVVRSARTDSNVEVP